MEEAKVRVQGLVKVFGEKPERALASVEQGFSREEIKKRTGNVVALRDISFEVARGEIFVVMGLSGSGKSTLLRCVNRLVEPTKGEVFVANQRVGALSKKDLIRFRRERAAMVFQGFGLFPSRTVLQNVVFGLEIQGVAKKERMERGRNALRQVGLENWAESTIDSLSGGMQQRVGLARALVVEPELLLMDEPFSALDPLIRTKMQDELLALQQQLKKTILFITHDLQEAIKLGDRIGILDQEGQLVQVGTAAEIFRTPANDYVQEFVENLGEQAVRIEQLEL